MKIEITRATPEQLKRKPAPGAGAGFGQIFTDHMFLMDYEEGKGWLNPRIQPYGPLSLDPAALVFHYGQEVFEGLKAYRWQDGDIYLFRPRLNYERLNRSARTLCMPAVDVEDMLEATRKLVWLERDWVPSEPGISLYLRPNMIAVEAALGVRVSAKYLFYIIATPVGAYYSGGFDPIGVYVAEEYTRGPAELGEAKTRGNYAVGLLAHQEAHQLGFSQILWLDGMERRYVEEIGTSNIFFHLDDELITPALTGTILPGITRDSVIHIARHWGLNVAERRISIDEVIAAIERGRVKEVFATGTATVITPVGKFAYGGKTYMINSGKTGSLAQQLHDYIVGIQYGIIRDPYGWMERGV